jgi:hypothetical protein
MLIEWLLTAMEMGLEQLIKLIKRRRHWIQCRPFFWFVFDFLSAIHIVQVDIAECQLLYYILFILYLNNEKTTHRHLDCP